MGELDLVLLTFVRALFFAALLFFASRRLIPFSVRAACACALVIFSPAGRQLAVSSAWILAVDPAATSAVTWQMLFREAALGVFLALLVAVPVLVIGGAAAWLRSFFIPALNEDELRWGGERTLSVVLVLWFFVAVLDLPGLREIFVLFGTLLTSAQPAGEAAFSASLLGSAVVFAGRAALQLSALIAGPLIVTGLAIDAVLFIAGRYLTELSTRQTAYAVKIPVFALLLLISLYPISAELSAQSGKLQSWAEQTARGGSLP